MQIFVLNKDPKKSANLLFNLDFKRANKQIVELGQILSAVSKNKYNIKNKKLYKNCFINHPIILWVSNKHINFLWTLQYLKELLNKFLIIRHKHHKTEIIYNTIILYKNNNIKKIFLYNKFNKK